MAVINTSGFNVGVMPNVNFLPAANFASGVENTIPNISRGVAFANQLQGISDAAVERPIKRQMDQIKLQQAQDALLSGADENKLRGLRIAAASQPLERILSTEVSRVPRLNSLYDSPALDENGNPTFTEGETNYDLVPVQKVEITDPNTGAKTITERRLAPIATSEQLGERQDKLEIARLREDSLGEQRRTTAALAAERLASPNWKRVGYGTNAAGKEVFVMVSKDGQKMEVPTELMPVQSGLGALGTVLQGITGNAPSQAPRNIAAPSAVQAAPIVAPEDTPAIDAETQGLIDQLKAAQTAPAASPYKNADDVRAAVKSGTITRDQAVKILREQFGFQ